MPLLDRSLPMILAMVAALVATPQVGRADRRGATRSTATSPGPEPFTQRHLITLPPWPAQQLSWSPAHRRWLPFLPPLPAPLAAGDMDGDGTVDLVVGQMAVSGEILLLRGMGDGRFAAPDTICAFDPLRPAPLTCILPVDIDADLDLDLYLVRWGPNELLINTGPGVFDRDLSRTREPLGLEDEGLGSAAAFFDADGDGDLDLLVANLLVPDGSFAGGPNVLYRQTAGRFCGEVFAAGPTGRAHTTAIAVLDLDLDGDQDVARCDYLAGQRIYRNDGRGRFDLCAADSAAVILMGVAGADLDGDLQPDLLFTALGHPGNHLERSCVRYSARPRVDLHGALGLQRWMLAAGPRFCDFDNDGAVDLLLRAAVEKGSTPVQRLLRSWPRLQDGLLPQPIPRFDLAGPQTRTPVWTLLGNRGSGWLEEVALGSLGDLRQAARGVLWLDANGDGRPDLITAEETGAVKLLLNQTGTGSKSLTVALRMRGANRFALGAEVYLLTSGGCRTGAVAPGSTDLQAADGRVHFGLGQDEPLELAVRWPAGGWQIQPMPGAQDAWAARFLRIEEEPDRIAHAPPAWLHGFFREAAEPSDSVFALERALVADPTDFTLGWQYRRLCRRRGLDQRPMSFFADGDHPTAPCAWGLQRLLATVDALASEERELTVLTGLAGRAIYELERLEILYPGTWIIQHLLGLNLLYWPPLFGQLDHTVAAFERAIRAQGDRAAPHLAESFVGLGDAFGMLDQPDRARDAWQAGARKFAGNSELEQRLSLETAAIKAFCLAQRSMRRMPGAHIPWIAAEMEYCPLGAERRRTAAGRPDAPWRGTGQSLFQAADLLESHLATETPLDPHHLDCGQWLSAPGTQDLWPHLRRGLVFLDYGFTVDHLESAAQELETYSRLLAACDLREPDGPWDERMAIGLLARGDIAMKVGDAHQGEADYESAAAVSEYGWVRLRELLPLRTDPTELWSPRFRALPRCGVR